MIGRGVMKALLYGTSIFRKIIKEGINSPSVPCSTPHLGGVCR